MADTAPHRGGRRRGLACAAAIPAARTAAPDLGSPPHVQVGAAATFVAPTGPGTPTCPSSSNPAGSSATRRRSSARPTTSRRAVGRPAGAGQTILVVEAYGSPTIADDLANFDTAFGIPAPPSLTVVNATGTGAEGSGDTVDWGAETSLDVEYAHAAAPGAAIVLAVAASDDLDDIVAAEQQVIPQYPGAIVCQSFGDDETDFSSLSDFRAMHRVFAAATTSRRHADRLDRRFRRDRRQRLRRGVVSGLRSARHGGRWDAGAALSRRALELEPGAYGGEQVWNEADAYDAATGGAPSILFRAPVWQRGVTGSRTRTVPDVSFNAAINGGVVVYYSTFVWTMGGTSAGVPEWAGIAALANELRARAHRRPLGFMTDNLYRLASSRRTYAAGLPRHHPGRQRARLHDRVQRRSRLRPGDRSRHARCRRVDRRPLERTVRQPVVRRSGSVGRRAARHGTRPSDTGI